ncbi:aa3-type cytochrome c oxidase subunit IV [Sphingomonas sp. DT-207]
MADNGENTTELNVHEGTYHGFTKMMLWGTVGCFLVAAFVVLTIAS